LRGKLQPVHSTEKLHAHVAPASSRQLRDAGKDAGATRTAAAVLLPNALRPLADYFANPTYPALCSNRTHQKINGLAWKMG